MGRRVAVLAGLLLLLGLCGFRELLAQGYRGEVRLEGGVFQLRPLERDSLPERRVQGTGLRRRLPDLTVVDCTPGEYCRWYRSGSVEDVSVITQEVHAVAWSAVQGLSAHAQLRGRIGTSAAWPRSEQRVEALSAYLNYDRGRYRIRAGRQYRTSGLGVYNFDGLSLLWRGFEPLRLEAYGGWSLGRGLNAPRSGDLLAAADEFAPDDRGLVFGGEIGAHWRRTVSGTLAYQREIRTDLDALYSERLAFDATALAGPLDLDVSAVYDLAFAQFNRARLRASVPLPRGLRLTLEGRHRTPFFELWTIWGAFSPVGYNEGSVSLGWRAAGTGVRLQAGGGYRAYDQTRAGTDIVPIRDDGWRAFGAAGWTDSRWYAGGSYEAEIGFGSTRQGGDANLGYLFGNGARIGLRATSTRTFGEFRLGEQRLTGLAVDGGFRAGRLRITGSGGIYRLTLDEAPAVTDWTQLRTYVSMAYVFGTHVGSAGDDR